MITAPTEFSGLQVWLDASDTTSLFQLSGGTTAVAANLDPVGYWGDKSGNSRHFTNIGGSATTRPTWVSSLSTVRFDGTNDYLSSFFNLTYTAQTVFMVMKVVAGNNTRPFLQNQGGTSPQPGTAYYQPFFNGGTIITSFASSLSSGGSNNSPISPRLSNNFDLFCSTHTGTFVRNVLNGNGSTTASHVLNYSVTQTRVGGSNDAVTTSTVLNGDISEVIVYNRALTNNERADVEYYLTRKWNFLNSIPRQTYAVKNGLWSDSATWSVSAEPSPWNFPLSADNAYTNTFTVTADSSTKVDTIRNSTLAPNILSGGSFVLADGVSLSANVAGGVAPYTLTLAPAASAILVGNVLNSPTGTGDIATLSAAGTTSLTVNGTVGGSSGGAFPVAKLTTTSNTFITNVTLDYQNTTIAGLVDHYNGTLTITGVLSGNSSGSGRYPLKVNSGIVNITGSVVPVLASSLFAQIINVVGGTTNVYSNVAGGVGSYAAIQHSGGSLNILGNLSQYAIQQFTAGTISLTGNVTASGVVNTITSTATTPLSVYGNIINAPNGRQAIYAPRYQVFPSASATYTRQAVNGYDSYADYWTSNATFTYPASSDVVLSTVYSNNTLSGSMALPPASAVALGASVGTTTGTAAPLTLEGILNQPVATLNTPNSIGARLKNVATTQALSAVANSLDFNN